jgi:lipoprotein-anchoring transpeptidase ErfK/SrfK
MSTGARIPGARPPGARAGHTAPAWGAAGLCALVLVLAGCSGPAPAGAADGKPASPGAARGAPAARPAGAPVSVPAALKDVRVNVADGATVGVGMPISLTFARPVPVAERAAVEMALTVDSSPRVIGAWSWIKDRNLLDGQRLDYRPRRFWRPGSEITLRIGRTGGRHFTIGRSLVATVDVPGHFMTVVNDGVTGRVPITAGAPGMDTWNGTMVVSDKQRRVLMDSRTVGYGDSYKGYYNYAVHLTASGTYLHENPKADVHAGRRNVSHGCVGLATDGTARRFFEEVIPGDVVRVTGSTDTVAAGNGYGDWNIGWERWLAGSALR